MADISLFKFQKKLYAVERLEPDAHELGAQMKATQTLVQFLSTKEYFLASTSALVPFSETTIEIHVGGRDKTSLDMAREKLAEDRAYFGTMMMQCGLADGMVSGTRQSTANTMRPALQIIKMQPGFKNVSSVFFMMLRDKVYVYADCAINVDPSAEELAEIAVASAATARAFGVAPRVAMLSYATGDSNKGPKIEKVIEATKLAKAMAPDERKGKLRVCKATDGLCHLQWGSRAEGMPFVPEDDFIIFPQESVMKFIPKPGVFVIKFPDDVSRNMFFWSQEPAGRFDDETLTARVNAALSGEHPDDAAPSAAPSIAARSAAIRQAQQAANSALAPRPDETPAATATVADTPAAPAKAKSDERSPAAPPSAVSGEALRAALGNLGGGGQGGSGSDAASAMAAMLSGMGGGPGPGGARARGPGLGDVLTPETVGPLLRGEDVRARLMEHLPEEHRDSQDLEELLRTPQFQSQLERFSAALTSGQMDLAQFGLQPGTGFSVAEFLSAIQALAEKEKREKGEGEDKATE